jgi:hypothetical protein
MQSSAKYTTKAKYVIFATAILLLANATQPFAFASENTSIDSSSQTSAKTNSELTLDNLQDVVYTLQRIRQQAINVYVECTRKPVNHYELNVVSLCAVPSTPLESPSVYLPLRKAWLVFFIGTMEPLVQILTEHVTHIDERTKQHHIPSKYLPEWQGMVNEWKTAIKQLNEQLDVCAVLLDDPEPCNIKVAESARSIDQQVAQLDNLLKRGSKFLRYKVNAHRAADYLKP